MNPGWYVAHEIVGGKEFVINFLQEKDKEVLQSVLYATCLKLKCLCLLEMQEKLNQTKIWKTQSETLGQSLQNDSFPAKVVEQQPCA